jgi:hypothetical protein
VKISVVQQNGAAKRYGLLQVGGCGEGPTDLHILHRTPALGSLQHKAGHFVRNLEYPIYEYMNNIYRFVTTVY